MGVSEIAFESKEYELSAFDLIDFLTRLNFAYEALSIFNSISSHEDIAEVMRLIEYRDGRPVLRGTHGHLMFFNKSGSHRLISTAVLSVKRIRINSPGELCFLGDLNPINNLKDIYVETLKHKRLTKKRQHEIEMEKKELEHKDQELKIKEEELKRKNLLEEKSANRQYELETSRLEIEKRKVELDATSKELDMRIKAVDAAQNMKLKQLKIVKKQIEMCKKLGLKDDEIQKLVQATVIEPVQMLVEKENKFILKESSPSNARDEMGSQKKSQP